jgi:PASTA domain
VSVFVEECRREWKRLGVPDSIADEMASELGADLEEASAEGVSAAEILGESDPRRFAASWASARGLVHESERPRHRKRRIVWWILGGVLALLVTGMILGVALVVEAAPPSVHTRTGTALGVGVSVPDLVGLREQAAIADVRASGLAFTIISVPHRPVGVVAAQAPSPGARVPHGTTVLLRVGAKS